MERSVVPRGEEALQPPGDVAGPQNQHQSVPPHRAARAGLSTVLAILAAIAALLGGVTLYVRDELVSTPAFADRAVTAVHQPAIERVIAREITVQVLEPALPDLIAARPLVQSATRAVVSSAPFASVIRLVAVHGHRLLFDRSAGNAVFDLTDAGLVITSALRNLSPKLTIDMPKRTEAILLTFKKRSFATETLRFADTVKLLGLLLPPVALVLFALTIAIAPERRRAITRSAVALGIGGLVLALVLELARRYAVAHVRGPVELSRSDVRSAVNELWGVFLGDLMTWTLVVSAVALIVAAASASWLTAYSPAAGLERVRALTRRPLSPRGRAVRGAGVLTLGLLALIDPALSVRVLVLAGGAMLIYIGAGELLTAVAPAEPRARRRPGLPPRRLAMAAGVALSCAVVIGLAFAFTGATSSVAARSLRACNGYAALCDRRLDEVVFAGTHNAMSAADSPGWLIPNQDRAIGAQLQDGIRLFKISTHYGVATASGRVYTDIAGEGQRLNRVAAKLSPIARLALQRFSRSLSGAARQGTREIWLCHTLCELGATRMVDFLAVIHRFLQLNPDQVIILFDEDYVAERDIQKAFMRAGLFSNLATLQQGQPLPTLAQLIRAHHNVVVFAQKPPSGRYAWNTNGFDWIQDTPLGAQKPSQFTCKRTGLGKNGPPSRGEPGNPLLMMNNWADVFPPRPSPNVPLVQRNFILKRAQQCEEQRGLLPNLILTDYYNRGQVVDAVAALNGVAGVQPAETTPVG